MKEEWIDDFINNIKYIYTPKEIFPYYHKIRGLLNTKNFIEFKRILDRLNIENINEVLILGLLRLSYPWRSKINNWEWFLDKSLVELNKRGLNGSEILKGL